MRTVLGHTIPESLAECLQHGRVALVIVDMQNDFVHPDGYCAKQLGREAVAGFGAVVAPIQHLLATARDTGAPVVFTRVLQQPDGSAASTVWIKDAVRYSMEPLHCMAGTWGHAIIDPFLPRAGEVTVDKPRRSAFQGTFLEQALRARGVTVLIVVGIAASGCVESTVRDAIEKDFLVVVPHDAISDGDTPISVRCRETFLNLLDPDRLTDSTTLASTWRNVAASERE